MQKSLVVFAFLTLSGCVEPAGPAVSTDPQIAIQQQQFALQQQALDQQKARDQAYQRILDQQAADARYARVRAEMNAGLPGVPQVNVPTVAQVAGTTPDQPPTASRIPGMQCSGEGDDASCDALGRVCSDGAIRDDCADAPLGY